MTDHCSNRYPPIPNADLKNCHAYEVDRVVVTQGGTVYVRMTNGSWKVVAMPVKEHSVNGELEELLRKARLASDAMTPDQREEMYRKLWP